MVWRRAFHFVAERMIPKWGNQFSDKITRNGQDPEFG
jgi:hypothetical protein